MKAVDKSNDSRLVEIRERRQMAEREMADIIAEAKKDRLCVAGDPWEALDPAGKKQRANAKRPCLSSDELNQYINQVVNGVRANPRGIRFAPTGNGANDKGAEFYQNHTREIEYRSHASMVYSTAFCDAVTSGMGWLRIKTKREHIRTRNQNIWIDIVANADQVLPDPNFIWSDFRDGKFLFYIEPWPVGEFKRRWPKAKIQDFTLSHRSIASDWLNREMVQVGEYWQLETYTRKLVAFQVPGEDTAREALLDELPDGKLPDGAENVRDDEDVDDERVEACITNGLEILDEIPWLGKYIPFVSCLGKQIYVDGGSGSRRRLLSLPRLARDPYMAYCYLITSEAEAVGGILRGGYIGYKGQFSNPNLWAKSAHEPVPFLEVLERTESTPPGQMLPHPERQSWDPPLQNMEMAIEGRRRAIQAAMGITPNPVPQQQNNQISGRAKEKFDSAAQRGSFHFNDSYDLMVERAGIIIEDLIDKVIDTARDVPVREEAGDEAKGSVVRVNDPNDPDSIFTKGDYRVTVSTGPDTDSQREAADDFVDSLLTNIEQIGQIAGPQVAKKILAMSMKLKQLGPIIDGVVQLIDPPAPNGKDGKPLPPEVQALMGQIQQLQQQLQQAQQAIQTKQIEQQGKFQTVKYQTDARSQDAAADRAVKLDVAAIEAKIETMAMVMEELQRIGGMKTDAATRLHQAGQAALDRYHDSAEQAKDRLHEHIIGAVEHQQALEQGKQTAKAALDQQAQAAALQPQDTGDGE